MKARKTVNSPYDTNKADTPAKSKLVSYLKAKDPTLKERELSELLDSIKRFVNLTKRIYKEPQATISYRHRVVRGETIKDRVFTTDLFELTKLKPKSKGPLGLEDFRKLHKNLTKTKYD